MKRFAYTVVAAFVLLVTLAAAPVSAQLIDGMAAEIPFAFEVEGARLGAGEYTVAPLTGSSALIIRRKEGVQGAVVLCLNAQAKGEYSSSRRLVFHKYGDQYFLASVWEGDQGKEVRQSQRERRLRKELSRGQVAGKAGAAPEVVMIVAAPR